MLFYLRSVDETSDLSKMFGTSLQYDKLPERQKMVFTHVDNPRALFLQYRVKEIIPKTLNVSPSITCTGDDVKTNTGVILKIFFLLTDSASLSIQRLCYESQVYQYVTHELAPFTRLFTPWYGTFMFKGNNLDIGSWSPEELTEFCTTLQKSGHYTGYSALYKEFTLQRGVNMAFAQITRRFPDDLTLLQYLQTDTTLKYLEQIIFQVVFALACMEELRIQHNDLHINNILTTFDLPKRLQGYYFKGALFWLNQIMQVRIFDWDAAYVEKLGVNYGLSEEMYSEIGIGNHFNPRYDIYMFLSSLENFFVQNNIPQHPSIAGFIRTVRPRLYQIKQNRLCNVDPQTGTCVPFPPNEPADVLTAQQALLLPFFNQFRETAPVVQQIIQRGIVQFKPPTKSLLGRLFSS